MDTGSCKNDRSDFTRDREKLTGVTLHGAAGIAAGAGGRVSLWAHNLSHWLIRVPLAGSLASTLAGRYRCGRWPTPCRMTRVTLQK